MRRSWLWIGLTATILVGGVLWIRHGRQAALPTVQQVGVTRGDLTQSISSTGVLSALTEVTVGSQVSGIVTKVLVDFNDRVKKDQVIAVIDPQTLQAQADSAEANVNLRRVAYEEAQRQLAEGKRLAAQKYIAETDLRTLEAAVRSTKAQLEAAVVDFNKQSVQLRYAIIRAPIDGVVMSRTVDPGNTVAASLQAPTLFVIASDLTRLKILANVDETQIPQIKQGQKARFTVSGIEGRTFQAQVEQVRLKPTTVNNVVTYTVVLTAENPDLSLYPGMTATIDFVSSELHDVLLVPTAALRVRIPDSLRAESASSSASAASGVAGSAAGATKRPGERPAGRHAAVWRVDAKGLAFRVPVKVLGSDLVNTAIQPLRAEALAEGTQVILKVNEDGATSSGSSSSRRAGNMMFGPGGR